MKKVYQTIFGEPLGNCFNACLASILEISIEEVPCFHEPRGVWYQEYKKWLRQYELDLIAVVNWDENKDNHPLVYAIVSGTSPRGFAHATVYFGLEMVHDPHPQGGGVKDITDWIYVVARKYQMVKTAREKPKTVFDLQQEAWFENGCRGKVEDYYV